METVFQYVPLLLIAAAVVYFVYRDHKKSEDAKPAAKPEPLKVVVPKAAEPATPEDDTEKEVGKAKVALDTAGIKGKERLDTIASVRRHEVTGDEVVEAHKK